MRQPKPNFFVLGAPKCGTTALCEYLREHPDVGFSTPKEPHYFCTDYSRRFRVLFSEEEYLRCFADVRATCSAIGEGSAWYLYSQSAVENILRFEPAAKFIVMLRSPVEMVSSWHTQALYSRDETVVDFKTAWNLQTERSKGRRIPASTREPKFLLYKDVACFSRQLGRLYTQVPRKRVHVAVLDDFESDAGAAYRSVLQFLGVPDDGRREFPRINEAKAHRSVALGHFLHRPPSQLVRSVLAVKEKLGIYRLGVVNALTRLNTKRGKPASMDAEFRAELADEFRDDVRELSKILSRDLSSWLDVRPGGR
jgi:Sulfotransferase family